MLFGAGMSIVEVGTAIAMVRAAGISGDALLKAQSRAWAREIALSVPTRFLKVSEGSWIVQSAADLASVVALQAGRMEDLDTIAKLITG